ncbi:MAG TPA: DegQ family serine endoprotease [Stellaceae bacterium]|nr:DegQ family serine endoprotease [Stellaceae bacterium]
MSRFTSTLLTSAALAAFIAASAPAVAADQVPQSREAIHLTFAPVVKRVAPAVVNVYSRRVIRTGAGPGSLFNDPLFQRFFGNMAPFGMPRERIENSLGSGVIVDPDGLIVTNHHVIDGADEINVVLSDRREFKARVILSDQRADLAVLRVDTGGTKLPTLSIGDSDAIQVGDLVLAIGDPFGVGQTVTMGIVSGLARSIGTGDLGSFIQTDAAINPGNSGGALVDLEGRLIGINSAIFSQSGGSVGIGFAIPASMVRGDVEAARHGGRVTRPWLGASGQAVTPDLARGLHLPLPEGVLIKDVTPHSPAGAAGLRNGDVVLSVNGHEVTSPDELRFRIATLPSNAHADFTVWRSGTRRAVTVALEAPPETPPRDTTTLQGREPFAGATVANLNPALAAELGIDEGESGVIVRAIARGSIAQDIGLQPGDFVLAVNDADIDSVATLRQAARVAGPWRLVIRRNGRRIAFTVGR